MSASLVGSEMCIRDSSTYYSSSSSSSPSSSLSLSAHCLRLASAVPLPVSYTHLTLPTICSV
eukprot:11020734-Alexandrium_andersonii.AAC.1